jgi:metal-responsive CopG/Arc/MetJ family transcriptional regulator
MATATTMKHVGFTVPPPMEEELEQMAKEEHRTKSELFREMVRVYRSYRKRHPEPEIDDEWVMQVIREAEEEQERNPMTDEEEEKLEQELLQYGAEQAKKKGISVKDEEEIDYIIYEARARWREKQKNRT